MERPPQQPELFASVDPPKERVRRVDTIKNEKTSQAKQNELFFRKEPPKNNKKIKREREKRTVRGLLAGFHQKNDELIRQDEVRHKQFVIDQARGKTLTDTAATKHEENVSPTNKDRQ